MSLFKVRRHVIYSLYNTCVSTPGVDAALERTLFHSPVLQLLFTDFLSLSEDFLADARFDRSRLKRPTGVSCALSKPHSGSFLLLFTQPLLKYCRTWIQIQLQADC